MGWLQVSALLVLREGVRWEGMQQDESSSDVCGADTEQPVLRSEDVREFCIKKGLSPFMVPRVMFAKHEPLPTNASGKVLKQEVRRRMVQMLEQPQLPQSRM